MKPERRKNMRRILMVALFVLAVVSIFQLFHSAVAQDLAHDGSSSEMVVQELDAGDIGPAAVLTPKTKIYGTWGQNNVNSGGYYYMTYKFLNTSDYSCCTNFYTYFGIAKDGNYTMKVTILEQEAGVWVPATEGWPAFTDPMKWTSKKVPYTSGYYGISHHVHFLNPGLKQYKFQIIRPSDGAVLAQNTINFDVY